MKNVKLLLILSIILLSNLLQASLLPSFLLEQIHEDLQESSPCYLTNGLSSEEINTHWEQLKPHPLSMRAQFDGKHVVFTCSSGMTPSHHIRSSVMRSAIKRCLAKEQWKGKSLDVIVDMNDGILQAPLIPTLVFSKKSGLKNAILIPDFEALDSRQRPFLVSHILEASSKPWKEKQRKLFWRGSTTDGFLNGDPEHDLLIPRARLVSFNHPLIDAYFTTIVDVDPVHRPLVEKMYTLAPRIMPQKHLDYRYMIDVDGVSCCYTRTYWTLLSNCLLIKQKSNNIQWYYKGLKERENIIYTKTDLSDLPQILEMLELQEEESINQMIQSQSAFAQNYMSYECNLEYLNEVLWEYANQFKTPVKIKEKGTPFTDLFWDIRWWCVRTYQFIFQKF